MLLFLVQLVYKDPQLEEERSAQMFLFNTLILVTVGHWQNDSEFKRSTPVCNKCDF